MRFGEGIKRVEVSEAARVAVAADASVGLRSSPGQPMTFRLERAQTPPPLLNREREAALPCPGTAPSLPSCDRRPGAESDRGPNRVHALRRELHHRARELPEPHGRAHKKGEQGTLPKQSRRASAAKVLYVLSFSQLSRLLPTRAHLQERRCWRKSLFRKQAAWPNRNRNALVRAFQIPDPSSNEE